MSKLLKLVLGLVIIVLIGCANSSTALGKADGNTPVTTDGITTIYDVNKLTGANGKNANVRLVARDMAVSEWHDETGKLQRRLLFLGPESTVKKEMDISQSAGPIFTPDKKEFGLLLWNEKREKSFVYYSIQGVEKGRINIPEDQSVQCFLSNYVVLRDFELHMVVPDKKLTFVDLTTGVKKIAGDTELGFLGAKTISPDVIIAEGVQKSLWIIQAYKPDGTLIWSYKFPPGVSGNIETGPNFSYSLMRGRSYANPRAGRVIADIIDKTGHVIHSFKNTDYIDKICFGIDSFIIIDDSKVSAYDYKGNGLWKNSAPKGRILNATCSNDQKRIITVHATDNNTNVTTWNTTDGSIYEESSLPIILTEKDTPREVTILEVEPGSIEIFIDNKGVFHLR